MTRKTLSLIAATILLTVNTFANETLEPITIISSNKTEQNIKDTTANITVITAEDIEENGYHTLGEAISHKAGMTISRSGGLGQLTSLFTRGMNSGQTLVLLDGMRMNDPSTPNTAAQLETLCIANIAQIEIIKGGSSSIWGSNASAGVINIITKKARHGLHASLGLEYGSYASKGVNTNLSYANKKLNMQILASKFNTDGISAKAPRSAEEDAYENKSYNIKLGYAFNKSNHIALSYNDIKTNMDYDSSSANDKDTNGDTEQKNYALDYTFKLDMYTATLHASKSDIERNYLSISKFAAYSSLNESSSKEYSLINQYNYSNNKVILGLEYKDINGLFKSSYDLREAGYKNKAIFLSNIYHISDSSFMETNIRYDDFDNFDDKVTYKIGFKKKTHNFLDGFTTSANYYTSYDAPSTYQLAKQSPIISLLKPVHTKGYDVSVGYKNFLTLVYFKNEVEDNIDNVGDFKNPAYANSNAKEKFSGIEVQSSYMIRDINLNITANYTHLLDYKKTDGKSLIRRAKETLNASASKYLGDDTFIGLSVQYIGDREDTKFNPDFSTSKVSTGNYTLWNINFSTKIQENLDLFLHSKNFFDKKYTSAYGYATEGASFYAKVKYSF